MVFNITFKVLRPGAILPYSHQYELSAWIYKMIAGSNSQLATFLHDKGYAQGFKNFKLFAFSNIFIPRFETHTKGLKILSPNINFSISFLVDQVAESMISTLFAQQKLILGNQQTQVPLQVSQIESLPYKITQETMQFRTTSPLVISDFETLPNGRTQANYLHPEDAIYESLFFKNLCDKYAGAVQHQVIAADANYKDASAMHFRVLGSRIRSKLVTIKAGTPAQTKVRGYMFDFEVTAPQVLLRVGYLGGFGGQSAMGFGACKILR